ncbi:hypothetical protein ACIBQ5_18840 [Streptomyces massasporeus]|uniref:hypothetical protein n=1 Tax=Streptomyces massasporeus TaxID=67324 RepID=UPI0037B875CB
MILHDLYAALAAALLVTAAVLVGRNIQHSHHTLFVNWPPLLATWDPHVGPGTLAALLLAAAVVAYGPVLAARLPWRALLTTAWATATGWIAWLALTDGWQRGCGGRAPCCSGGARNPPSTSASPYSCPRPSSPSWSPTCPA